MTTTTCPCLPTLGTPRQDTLSPSPQPSPATASDRPPTPRSAAPDEPFSESGTETSAERLGRSSTWMSGLRAGVLGANDGIVSIAGVLVGVAGATTSHAALTMAGVVALVAGAASMAAGEYVSVAAQRDAEQAGLADISDGADGELTNPWVAAIVSAVSFTLGAVLPLLVMLSVVAGARVPATAAAALAALAITGAVSARFAQAPAGRAMVRNMVVGGAAMALTYGAGLLLGAA